MLLSLMVGFKCHILANSIFRSLYVESLSNSFAEIVFFYILSLLLLLLLLSLLVYLWSITGFPCLPLSVFPFLTQPCVYSLEKINE